jgi:hypothetical protein
VKTIVVALFTVLLVAAPAQSQNSIQSLRQGLISPLPDHPLSLSGMTDNGAIPQKKNQGSAVFYSLLLPGMGELYAGDFATGRYSLVAEATLWLTYISFQQYGSWIQADSRAYAMTHAGASTGGKDDQFFVSIGNFQNIYDYNDKKLRDRNISQVYDPAQGYYWNWDNDADRQRFKALRISSAKVFDNSRFVIGAVIVNHIVSALNAARLVRHYNRGIEESMGSWQLEPNVVSGLGQIGGLKLTYTQRF